MHSSSAYLAALNAPIYSSATFVDGAKCNSRAYAALVKASRVRCTLRGLPLDAALAILCMPRAPVFLLSEYDARFYQIHTVESIHPCIPPSMHAFVHKERDPMSERRPVQTSPGIGSDGFVPLPLCIKHIRRMRRDGCTQVQYLICCSEFRACAFPYGSGKLR
jgi:hypothetical protein